MPIRVVTIEGNPWFVAADVRRALGLRQYGGWLDCLASDERREIPRGLASGRGMTQAALISESGLYKLVMRSDKPQARRFQDWVTRDVLPAIRKDGAYVLGEERVKVGEMDEDELILRAMEAMRRKIERLTKERDVLSAEVNMVTVDEYRALSHAYLTHRERVRLGVAATRLANTVDIAFASVAASPN